MPTTNTLCNSFRAEAGRVWREMGAAQKLGMSLGEETITETCLFNIAKRHVPGNLIIVPATKPEEAVHGADWEWWFANGGKGIGFRVQAKRLFPSGRYDSLFKAKTPFVQLDKLVAEAHKDNLNPLYCFYNFDNPVGGFPGHGNNCLRDYRGPSFWGCAVALPDDVKAIGKNSIKDLRPILEPWHTLVCGKSGTILPQSVGANLLSAARARSVNGTRRGDISVNVEPRIVPDYVTRLVALGRERREGQTPDLPYVDHAFWSEMADNKRLAGVLVVAEE